MSIYTDGNWANGCTHRIVLDENSELPKPDGNVIATWLFGLHWKQFCDALQEMVDSGFMSQRKADKTIDAYDKKEKQTLNAYEGGEDNGI
jgi:hypothetical protein